MTPKYRHGKRSEGHWHSTTTNKRGHQHVKTRMRRSLKRSIRRDELSYALGGR